MRAFGSLMNRIMEDIKPPKPEVGMGATELMFSDRHAFTIVEVAPNGKVCWVTHDTCIKADDYDYFGNQDYKEFQPNMDSPYRTKLKLCKDGRWRVVYNVWKIRKDGSGYWGERTGSTVFRLGSREEYQDPSF